MVLAATDWLPTSEAARRLGVSAEYVRQLANAGKLAYERTALGRLIDPASVEALRRSKQMPTEVAGK